MRTDHRHQLPRQRIAKVSACEAERQRPWHAVEIDPRMARRRSSGWLRRQEGLGVEPRKAALPSGSKREQPVRE
jgi:hypothetical protein